ncbi:MAG: sn-glycerol-1-phosphate dehydrogenase [Ruminococcaceae bacterium]|nr:sn-glycerol-1-phosphate dehydrogenase [Oscillospiraceae bacterium]
MDIKKLIAEYEGCPCGREHKTDIKAVEIGHNYKDNIAEILHSVNFPEKVFAVADKNTLGASDGIIEALERGGFKVTLKLYDNLRVADMENVDDIAALAADCGGFLAIGTGSIGDTCRLAAAKTNKDFAFFGTAPSMDGFASDSAPITKGCFKISYKARQPSVIIGDTKILAAAPAELKSSGFSDMIAKYTGLVDWDVSRFISDEYYCPNIAALTKRATDKIVALADKITGNDETAAEAVMEALILTGVAMGFAECTRPASGAEHIVSHFWECKKLAEGHLSDFHGKKVGVATILINREYRKLAELETVRAHEEKADWEEIKAVYGPVLTPDMLKMNDPSILDTTSPARIEAAWQDIRDSVKRFIPSEEEILRIMKTAGCATTIEEIGVTPELCELGLKYHSYMRRRLTLARIRPLIV